MSKLVVISLGRSDLGTGFPQVSAQVWSDEQSVPAKLTGGLPAAREITKLYRRWQELYGVFYKRGLRGSIEIVEDDITNFSETEFDELRQQLQKQINAWLDSGEFRYIEYQLRSQLSTNEEIQLVLEAEDDLLQRLPWQLWNFLRDYRQAEIALSSPNYQNPNSKISRSKLRILAILGDSSGIDVQADRKLLETLPNAETVFLVEPERREVDQWLWDEQGWDILFFAGHSQTEAETGRIHINPNESLTILDLNNAFNKAIERGLQLAIFNSCDGLGLARQLADLNIPQMIVMREPVPDRIAQEFLKYFLSAFSGGKSVYASVREARERLQGLEGEFPCASWLPALCHNPAAKTLSWQELVDRLLHPSAPIRPYQGLFAFQEKDASLFFGRETFVNQLVEAVRTRHLVAVVGPSGSGKSSVVFAGLIPNLWATNEWEIISCRLGDRPFQSLAVELIPLLDPNLGRTERILRTRQLGTSLQQEELNLHEVIRDILSEASKPRLLLVIDQFEELYTLCRIPEERQKFLDQLLEAVDSSLQFTVVLTLRADFYGQVLSSRPFSDALQGADIKLGPMNREELQDTIVKPAELFGVQVEPGLTGRILDEIKQEPGSLPLLEFALTQLWDKRGDNRLTHAAYNEIGGVKAALARYADEVYEQLTPEDQKRTEQVFIQLVRPGEGTEDTRRVATRSEVGEENWALVRQLADARLVVTGRIEKAAQGKTSDTEEQVPIQAEETVEVVHEALIREWQQLREWMNASRDFRVWQEGLKVDMRQWQNMGCDEGALLRGAPLTVAEDWLQKRKVELSLDEQEYIQEGLKVREREQIEQERQQTERLNLQKRAIWGLAGGLGVALVLALLAGTQWLRAESQKGQVVVSEINALRSSSETLFTQNYKFDALMEGLKAASRLKKNGGSDEVQTQIAGTLQQAISGVREHNRFEGHDAVIYKVAISPDGKTIASASADGTVKLWQKDGTLIETLKGHNGSVRSVAFSPDGQQIVSAGDDSTVRFWDLSGKQINQWANKEEISGGIGIRVGDQPSKSDKTKITLLVTEVNENSPAQKAGIRKGDRILSVNGKSSTEITSQRSVEIVNTEIKGQAGTTVTLQIAREGTQDFELSIKRENVTFTNAVYSLSFSPDGKNIATAGDNGKVMLWNLDGAPIANLSGHSGIVRCVTFSPDGKLIATASSDGTVKIWNFDGTERKTIKKENQEAFTSVSFSPGGNYIVTGTSQGSVDLWWRNGEFATNLISYLKGTSWQDVAFSSDGRFIASSNEDGLIALWNSEGQLLDGLLGHSDTVSSIAFGSDGNEIISGSYDRTIRLWNTSSNLIKYLGDNGTYLFSDMNFSPDGSTIASVENGNKVKLWNQDGTLRENWKVPEKTGGIKISPDGQLIASFGGDEAIKLWGLNGELQASIEGQRGGISNVSFSPDGKTIASVDAAGKIVKLWNRDGTSLKTLEDISDQTEKKSNINLISVAKFSPDGQEIVTAGRIGDSNGVIKIWDRNGNLLKTTLEPKGVVTNVDFSPDGKRVAVASTDSKVYILDRDSSLLTTLQGHIGAVWDVSFSSDGKLLVSAGDDTTVRLWSSDGKPLSTLKGHLAPAARVRFSPDGKTVASVGNDKKIILWNIGSSLDELSAKSCYWMQNYLKLNSKLEERDREICDGVENDWIAEGEELARSGNVQDAISMFQKAQGKAPEQSYELKLDPAVRANKLIAESLVAEGRRLAIQGNIPEAITTYNKAVTAYKEANEAEPELRISAGDWSTLCWFGSKHGHPREILFACENAIKAFQKIDPESGLFQNGLGVAKLLVGENREAAEDFKAFIAWWDQVKKENNNSLTEFQKKRIARMSERRQRWVQKLEAGENLDLTYETNLLWEEE